MFSRLTFVAGSGELVPHLAVAARKAARALQIIDLAGRAESLPADEFARHSLSRASVLIGAIKAFAPSHLLFGGGVHISDVERRELARSFGVVGSVASGVGDIGLAGMILLYSKMQGIRLVGAQDVAPDLVAPAGHIAGPPAGERIEPARSALKLAKQVGAADFGQSVVVSGRRAVAAEDIGGTDALLARVAALVAAGLIDPQVNALILAKAKKPKQPGFIDLPAIGPETVINANKASIGMIVVEAGNSLLLDRQRLMAEAAARGVTIIGLKHG